MINESIKNSLKNKSDNGSAFPPL